MKSKPIIAQLSLTEPEVQQAVVALKLVVCGLPPPPTICDRASKKRNRRFLLVSELLANNQTYLSYFLSMLEAKAREYFQCARHSFLVPATELPETVQLVFIMELPISRFQKVQ